MIRTSKSAWVIEALDQHERSLLRYARGLLGDLAAAQDVVQETFLRLCKEDPQRIGGHLAQWLFTVCRNLALDSHRRSARHAPLEQAEVAVASDLEERHDTQQTLGRVLEILDTLPRNQREVVDLRFQGGLSYKEISGVTGLSVSNVGFLLHTAMHAIRDHLAAATSGAGHEYSANQSERSEVDRVRSGRARRG